MQINGKSLTSEDGTIDMSAIFDKAVLDSLPETMPEELDSNAQFEIKESNIKAEVPMRFADSRFGEYDYPQLKEMIELAIEPGDKVCVICGPIGVGKSTVLCSAIHERAARGYECGLYFNMRMLMPKLRTCRSFTAKENEEAFYNRLSRVSFLCLDEAGTCPNFKEESEFLTTLLCQRFDNCLPTWIATNLGQVNFLLLLGGVNPNEVDPNNRRQELEKLKVSNPTVDRILSISKGFTITGSSHRGETK